MKASEILEIKRSIKSNIVKGDYIILGKMLDIEHSAARMRFNRCNDEAVLAMKLIIENRNELIKSYKAKQMVKTINGLPEGFAVLDLISAKSGRIAVVLITNRKNHETVYDNIQQMDDSCIQFIEPILKSEKVSNIITDCSLGYLPSVISLIKQLNIKQYYQHPLAARSESIIQLLRKRY